MIHKTILHVLAHNAASFPDNTAIIEGVGGRQISYGGLWRRITNFSAVLTQRGFLRGERVIIRVTQTIDCLVAIYGIQLAGGTVIPVEANLDEMKIIELLGYFDSSTLISTQPIDYECLFIDLHTVMSDPDSTSQPIFPDPNDLAMIIYTTGTTGRSKGVMLTFQNRLLGADNQSVEIGISHEDVGFISQPLSHSGGLRRCDVLFLYGGSVVLFNGIGLIKDLFLSLTRHQVTILWFVPAQLSLVVKRGRNELAALDKQLRVVIFESAKPFESQKEELRALLPNTRLYVNYSSTEATGTCHFEYSAFPPMPDCVGKGITPHSKVMFVDEKGIEVEATKNNPAIIASEGGSVALGYWKEPVLTATAFKEGRLLSADIGYKDENGFIYVIGRRDDVIVSGGNKISPSEVEDAAMLIGEVKECACIPVEDSIMGYMPKLYVVMEDNKEFSRKDIYEFLSKRLEPFKVPQKIECIDELPRVGVGKVSRKTLIELSKNRGMEEKQS